jgi:hypothetical protein
MVAVMNSAGETTSSFPVGRSGDIHGGQPVERTVEDAGDLLYVPHIGTSFELTNTQTLLLGASAALGANNSGTGRAHADSGARTSTGSGSRRARSRASRSCRSRARRCSATYDARSGFAVAAATLPAEVLHGPAAPTRQILWGIKPLWVAGVRGEFANGDDAAFDSEIRQDAALTASRQSDLVSTEFSKTRLQIQLRPPRQRGRRSLASGCRSDSCSAPHAAHKF